MSKVHALNFSRYHLSEQGVPVVRYKQWMRQHIWIKYKAKLEFETQLHLIRTLLLI